MKYESLQAENIDLYLTSSKQKKRSIIYDIHFEYEDIFKGNFTNYGLILLRLLSFFFLYLFVGSNFY